MGLRDGLREKREQAESMLYTEEMAADNRGIMSEVRMIGGGLVLVLIVTLVLTEVYDAIEIDEESSPFYDVVESLEGTGVAALTLLVVGFLVIAASAIMRYFNGGFGGGR